MFDYSFILDINERGCSLHSIEFIERFWNRYNFQLKIYFGIKHFSPIMTSNIFFLPKSFPYFHGFRFYISTTNNIKCIIDDRLGNGNDFEETLRTRAGTEECKIDFFMSFFFGN